MTLNKFRNLQHIISSLIFLIIFCFFCTTTKLNLTEIQLSHWGGNHDFSWLWNFSVVLISISFYFNSKKYINSYPELNKRKTISLLFTITSICLFLTGVININYLYPHDLFAFGYFLTAPLAIFSFAHFNPKKISVTAWRTNLTISTLLIVLPIIAIFFYNGLAISEIIHTVLIMSWNFIILKKL